jgi:hypothetical protein
MFNPFKLLSQCKDRAMKAIEQSEECASAYHESLGKNSDAHDVLMEKIDRRGPNRKMSAA